MCDLVIGVEMEMEQTVILTPEQISRLHKLSVVGAKRNLHKLSVVGAKRTFIIVRCWCVKNLHFNKYKPRSGYKTCHGYNLARCCSISWSFLWQFKRPNQNQRIYWKGQIWKKLFLPQGSFHPALLHQIRDGETLDLLHQSEEIVEILLFSSSCYYKGEIPYKLSQE